MSESNTETPVQQTLVTETKSGRNVEYVITPYVKLSNYATHNYVESRGINYDIPLEGKENLLIQVMDEGMPVPLGVVSLTSQGETNLIPMIQMVKAYKKEIEDDKGKKIGKIEFGPVYIKTEHPLKDLIQGDDRINWQHLLLDEAERKSKADGFNYLKISSGFSSKYLESGHKLPMAIQQYDMLVSSNEDWVPFNKNDQEIVLDRKVLHGILRSLVRGKIMDEDITSRLMLEKQPAYWKKKIT